MHERQGGWLDEEVAVEKMEEIPIQRPQKTSGPYQEFKIPMVYLRIDEK